MSHHEIGDGQASHTECGDGEVRDAIPIRVRFNGHLSASRFEPEFAGKA